MGGSDVEILFLFIREIFDLSAFHVLLWVK